ncbi:MAG: carboxypeptidase-like regulatory domain-containing protein [Bacteroidota bacterium]
MKYIFIFIFLLTAPISIYARQNFQISGKVLNGKGEPIQSATVFLDGSQKSTSTNTKGEYVLTGIQSGTYQLVVNMLGYQSQKENVLVQQESSILNVTLKEKAIILKEVLIGKNSSREQFMKIFIKNFLGESENAKSCKILNTNIIDFSSKNKLLEAITDDFLIIENKNLGYKIRYLLRNFLHNGNTETTSYDGECIFEDLPGSPEQQKKWKANRLAAYQGSWMHYLRSLYQNNAEQQGFFTYKTIGSGIPATVDQRPVLTQTFVQHADSTFILFRSKERLYAVYDADQFIRKKKPMKTPDMGDYLSRNGTIVKLFLDKAVIDGKGSIVDYRSFLLNGFWSGKRIGDQLPFEYLPAEN